MSALLAAGIGLVAGIHAATWGMYKDAPHEGFSRWKYARSPLLGAVLATVVSGAPCSTRARRWIWCCSSV